VKRSTGVWITGVGAVTPLGHRYQAIADNLLAGRSGICKVTSFDVAQHPSQVAAQIDAIPCPSNWNEDDFRRLLRLEQVTHWCCTQALRDAGRWGDRHNVRFGVVLGLGAEWLTLWDADVKRGGQRIFSPQEQTEPLARAVCRRLELSGPAVSVAAACASGNYALSLARRWLELGWVDVCLAGACDAGVSPMGMAGFGNLRALSRRNDAPQAASRPFDRGRDGFVIGEAGAVFVLERAEAARARSAHVYAEVAGCGASSDAHNMVIPSPDPEPAIMAMRRALADARVEPGAVDYINAHATSTPVGDIAETNVLRAVLGDAVRTVPVSSTKSMTGHCLTAAAAIEVLACLAAMERSAVPPTVNLDDPDPECTLCHVPHQARSQPVRVAVSNSFGFGGSNTCLVLKAAS
jgi:3-oxoacyl-[acyl-carrier-protein] synthase II